MEHNIITWTHGLLTLVLQTLHLTSPRVVAVFPPLLRIRLFIPLLIPGCFWDLLIGNINRMREERQFRVNKPLKRSIFFLIFQLLFLRCYIYCDKDVLSRTSKIAKCFFFLIFKFNFNFVFLLFLFFLYRFVLLIFYFTFFPSFSYLSIFFISIHFRFLSLASFIAFSFGWRAIGGSIQPAVSTGYI